LSNQDRGHIVLAAAEMRASKCFMPCSTRHLNAGTGWVKGCHKAGLEVASRQWAI